MALNLTGGEQVSRDVGAIQVLTNSTATAERTISLTHHITTIAGGTATGFNINKYVLPEGDDGTRKIIQLIATGELTVRVSAFATGLHYLGRNIDGAATASGIASSFVGAATGAFVLNAKSQYVELLFLDGGWRCIGGQATIATST